MPFLRDAKGKMKMITLVLKQDLWWDKKEEVEKHYTQGDYNKIIQEIAQPKQRDFQHEYLSASLVHLNLRHQNKTFVKTNKGYDKMFQQIHLNELLKHLNRFINV